MEPTKKAKKSLFQKFLDFFLPLGEKISIPVDRVDRLRSLVRTFGFGLFLGGAFIALVYIVAPPEDQEGFWKKIFSILENYPTIILVIPSLPVAFVLWLFRNHDNVKNLDLQMYKEAVINIHNKNAQTGLRQVAFETLMELREKSAWKEKIRTQVFPEANLRGLNLRNADLQGFNLEGAKLQEAKLDKTETEKEANLTEANLTRAILTKADLTETNLTRAFLTEANLTEANLTKAILTDANLTGADLKKADLTEVDLKGANLQGYYLCEAILDYVDLTEADLTDADLKSASLIRANLTDVILARTELSYADLHYAHCYKDGKKLLITKKWLEKRGARNTDTTVGIDFKPMDSRNTC